MTPPRDVSALRVDSTAIDREWGVGVDARTRGNERLTLPDAALGTLLPGADGLSTPPNKTGMLSGYPILPAALPSVVRLLLLKSCHICKRTAKHNA